jgi:ATP synthase protein I
MQKRTEASMTENRKEGLEERRKRLGAELAVRGVATRGEEEAEERVTQNRKGYAEAMKLSSEFISAVVVGAILGYLFDRFVGTAPWGMIVLLLLGFCAGVLNVLRTAGKVSSPHPADRSTDAEDKREAGR